MNPENETAQAGTAISVSDVVYILLRHKWKICTFTLLGFIAAGAIWFLKRPVFESDAKILVRYVSERRTPTGPGDAEIVREPERGGVSIINSEVEILTSTDCVLEAVSAVGAKKILAAYGGGTNEYAAAGVLLKHLTPKVGSSGVVAVSLGHPNAEIAREALIRLIEAYRRKHVRIHHATEAYDELQAEADRIRVRLSGTEAQLRAEKSKANVISLEEAKLDIFTQLSSLRASIFAAEAELAERRAELELAERRLGIEGQSNALTNGLESSQIEYADEKIDAYKTLTAKLAQLQSREYDLLLGNYAETSRSVVLVRQQIAETQAEISELGVNPAHVVSLSRQVAASAGLEINPQNDLDSMRAKAMGLEARIEQLRKQRAEMLEHSTVIEASEDKILQLERTREIDEAKLRQYESNLDKARLDQAIDSSKITNITIVQEPTPAGRDMMKLYKLMAGALFGMIGAGVGLGFVIEMFLDGSLKRPKDVEAKSRIPLFVSIPCFGVNGRPRLKLSRKAMKKGELQDATGLIRKGEIAPWEELDPMFEYYESLRDRVVMSYEGDPRKPKIVGVTSCNRGAGTTRISTGLAAALSRDVQRRVLFIGLEKNKVAVTAFFKGRPESEFAPSMEELGPDPEAHAVPELHTLVRTGHNTAGASIVQSFSDLIPKLRMSDYDYIIFDLPPVSETSGSLRLASQMERTLLVIESEETQKAKVDRVRDLLSGTGTQLSAVLNKTKTYGPQFLTGEA